MVAKLLPGIRTFDHAALDTDDAALERCERNLTGHRRLDPALKLIDLALQRWGPWAKPRYSELGYPTRSVTEAFNEGGILARDSGRPHPPEWPAVVAEVDREVAQLPTRHQAAVMATYFHLSLPCEQRATVYVRLSMYLARTRGAPLQRERRGTLGPGAFRQDLDRARWTLKFALRV
jgi:hypothetical protein